MLRIDTHHHVIPPDYRKALQKAGIAAAGGRVLPDWSPEASLQTLASSASAPLFCRCPHRARHYCPGRRGRPRA